MTITLEPQRWTLILGVGVVFLMARGLAAPKWYLIETVPKEQDAGEFYRQLEPFYNFVLSC
jgi:hypothetical protein